MQFSPGNYYKFRCNGIAPGRLFPDTDKNKYDCNFLENNILYYAIKSINGTAAHPLADLFFRTKKEIVLIDIGGENDFNGIAKKIKSHSEWIAREQPNNKQIKFHSIVIAPNAVGESYYDKSTGVTVVYGDNAVNLLGGLSQIHRWML
jgi:hypothetical protein